MAHAVVVIKEIKRKRIKNRFTLPPFAEKSIYPNGFGFA
jgi:hypothetical protein